MLTGRGRSAAVPALYALILGVSAACLFSVQPMVARMALPILGGTPGVWNTCMVFFQAAVLAGYAVAHGLATRTSPRVQAAIVLGAIVLGGAGLPVALVENLTGPPAAPVGWLLGWLTMEVGLPAVCLATASPLLQRWLSRLQPGGGEPYFLYAASNVGSLGALVAYPALVEPALTLSEQARSWSWGYWTWALLMAVAGAGTLRLAEGRIPRGSEVPGTTAGEAGRSPHPGPGRWLAWMILGAVPASLLQGCTLFLTTDVASVPLFWVIPLALYLLTFVVAFARRGQRVVGWADRLCPFLGAALLYAILARSTQPAAVLMGLHLGFLLVAGLTCHGRLVRLRPAPEHLTSFYLGLSVGGVAGGAFNALVAPWLFDSVAEYPLAIVLAGAALPRRAPRPASRRPGSREWPRDVAIAGALGTGVLMLGLVAPLALGAGSRWRDPVVFGSAAVAVAIQLDRPRRFALGLAAAFAAGLWLQGQWAGNRHAERNFFGITRVTVGGDGQFHQLVHGNTIHGRQFRDPSRRGEPLTYYHREGPLGPLFEAFRERTRGISPGASGSTSLGTPGAGPASRRVGVIGLGVGSMAAYAQPEERWDFFEIDPAVIRVASDPQWFSFLSDTRAGACRVVPGDARLRLGEEPDRAFDLLVVDAFSSDAIPVHLLTREAVALYFRKLRPGGWLAVHVSNRYLELEPIVAGLAADAGLACLGADDTDASGWAGKEPSQWMVLARKRAEFGGLLRRSLWVRAEAWPGVPVWTDQRSAILPVFQWR